VAVVIAWGVAACGRDTPPTTAGPALSGEVRVEAAASLTEAFTAIGTAFEAAHPEVKVTFDFGPSSGLSDSIVAGAPADVFASADTRNMDKLVAAKLVAADASGSVFARNQPEIAVPADNPGKVTGLADFAKPALLVGLCAPEVPCGKFARTVLMKAGITPSIDTNETDVKSLLAKIESDDLDVGLVYRTDVIAAGAKVKGIEIPDAQNVIASYPIAVLDQAPNAGAAKAFVAYVRSPASEQVLKAAGFLPPT